MGQIYHLGHTEIEQICSFVLFLITIYICVSHKQFYDNQLTISKQKIEEFSKYVPLKTELDTYELDRKKRSIERAIDAEMQTFSDRTARDSMNREKVIHSLFIETAAKFTGKGGIKRSRRSTESQDQTEDEKSLIEQLKEEIRSIEAEYKKLIEQEQAEETLRETENKKWAEDNFKVWVPNKHTNDTLPGATLHFVKLENNTDLGLTYHPEANVFNPRGLYAVISANFMERHKSIGYPFQLPITCLGWIVIGYGCFIVRPYHVKMEPEVMEAESLIAQSMTQWNKQMPGRVVILYIKVAEGFDDSAHYNSIQRV